MPNLKITLDTNCIINLFDASARTPTSVEPLNELVRLALSGQLDIAVTTRAEVDLRRDRNEQRRTDMLRFLDLMPVVGTALRWDMSKWDSGDVWGSESDLQVAAELQRLLSPGLQATDKRFANRVCDIDHLLGHLLNKRKVFVTDDRGILNKRAALRATFGLVVVSPRECLDLVHNTERCDAE